MDNIENTVKEYIQREFFPGADPSQLSVSTPLITGGYLDSLATLNLVGFLENEYKIQIDAHEVNADNMNTLEEIAGFVRSKM